MHDFSYTQSADGFTSIMPNTPDAEASYNAIFASGVYRLTPSEFTAFRTQARQAGYTVRKARPVSIDDADALLAELEA